MKKPSFTYLAQTNTASKSFCHASTFLVGGFTRIAFGCFWKQEARTDNDPAHNWLPVWTQVTSPKQYTRDALWDISPPKTPSKQFKRILYLDKWNRITDISWNAIQIYNAYVMLSYVALILTGPRTTAFIYGCSSVWCQHPWVLSTRGRHSAVCSCYNKNTNIFMGMKS